MAFQQPTILRQTPQRTTSQPLETPSPRGLSQPAIEQSQEWVLFSPSHTGSNTEKSRTSVTAGLSRASDLGSLQTGLRSGQLELSVLEEDATEDGELDSLDEGLHAFREPPSYPMASNQSNVPLLPTHDGLGTFPASGSLVLEQLWRYERHNSKRKHESHHRRSSSVQRKLDTVEELEAQANEDKRIRIEQWRMDQSQALIEEVEQATRRRARREPSHVDASHTTFESLLGSTPKQANYLPKAHDSSAEKEPFWRRLTRKFIRDVIGIDEPLLSVILGESLPGEFTPRSPSPIDFSSTTERRQEPQEHHEWRDKLLHRIAKELGLFVHQLSPHPGAFSTYEASKSTPDYAGIPIRMQNIKNHDSTCAQPGKIEGSRSIPTPNFAPTLKDHLHAESWGFEEDNNVRSSNVPLDLDQERDYWEKELDINIILCYLKNRFTPHPDEDTTHTISGYNDSSASRAAIIRQHHPLVGQSHKPSSRRRRDSRQILRRPISSCAGESVRSVSRASALRSGSSRNYWDIGGSVGSGSLVASGGLMGAWGEV